MVKVGVDPHGVPYFRSICKKCHSRQVTRLDVKSRNSDRPPGKTKKASVTPLMRPHDDGPHFRRWLAEQVAIIQRSPFYGDNDV